MISEETVLLVIGGGFTTLLAFLVKLCVSQRREIRKLNARLFKVAQEGRLSEAELEAMAKDSTRVFDDMGSD